SAAWSWPFVTPREHWCGSSMPQGRDWWLQPRGAGHMRHLARSDAAIWATSRVRRVGQASVTPIDRNAVLPRLEGQLYAGGGAIGSFSRVKLTICDTWRGRMPRFATPPGAREGGSRVLRHLPVCPGGGSRDLRHLPVRGRGELLRSSGPSLQRGADDPLDLV